MKNKVHMPEGFFNHFSALVGARTFVVMNTHVHGIDNLSNSFARIMKMDSEQAFGMHTSISGSLSDEGLKGFTITKPGDAIEAAIEVFRSASYEIKPHLAYYANTFDDDVVICEATDFLMLVCQIRSIEHIYNKLLDGKKGRVHLTKSRICGEYNISVN